MEKNKNENKMKATNPLMYMKDQGQQSIPQKNISVYNLHGEKKKKKGSLEKKNVKSLPFSFYLFIFSIKKFVADKIVI